MHADGIGKPADIVDRDVALRPLNRANVGTMKSRSLSKLFLRDLQTATETAKIRRDQGAPVDRLSGTRPIRVRLPKSPPHRR